MTELETSRELSRAEVAAYLREFADELDRQSDGTTQHGDEAHPTETPNRTTGGSTDSQTTGTTDATRTSRNSPDTATTTEDNTVDTAEATSSDAADGNRSHADTDYRKVTFLVGNDSATINPPETVSFDVAVDSDSSLMEAGTRERVDFSISWDADSVPEDDELRIE
ncbi:hypothetical protein [Haloprofundus salinisoli]|uniref:hypothetical protein n=1 Tax=Haloprofundus salinisoli TaxID=2876193 RepID=UPI001CCB32BB|nr:hypothetical protein [Haloprofundus salinisoli]